ncbi:MAG TPA: glycosyltransferase family 2 protein [Bryobacteraceae bacterium]|nr:glycosyltransferase family 2 protein [Bryobacteraceae bacterium]
MSQDDVTPVDVSVVIVNHNHRRVIEKCVQSLYSLPDRATFEAVLIDNTSADGTADWVSEHFPQVLIRRNRARRGFAANANSGLRLLRRGRYALLLNPDVICLPGLLDALVAFMDGHAGAGIAAPQLSNTDGTRQANGRRFPTPAALAFRALRLDDVWQPASVRRYLMDRGSPGLLEVDWVTGAALMARRAAMESAGLLDERYFLYWEDLDWCYRMRRAGWRVYRVPEARAIHAHQREGVRRPFSRAGFEQLAGAVRFFRKFGWNAGRAA